MGKIGGSAAEFIYQIAVLNVISRTESESVVIEAADVHSQIKYGFAEVHQKNYFERLEHT